MQLKLGNLDYQTQATHAIVKLFIAILKIPQKMQILMAYALNYLA